MYFLTILLAVCPNINPTILCAHVCDVNYAACYSDILILILIKAKEAKKETSNEESTKQHTK